MSGTRRHLRPAHVAPEALVELVVRRGLAELLDDQARDCRPALCRRRRGSGAILPAASSALPLTSNWTSAEWRSAETRPAFGWSIGETMFVTSGSRASVWITPRDGRCEGRPVDGRREGLHEHALPRRDVEVTLVEDLLGPARIAVGDRPRLHLPGADGAADQHRGNGERHPAEGRKLPVGGAPAACPSCEIRAHVGLLRPSARPRYAGVRWLRNRRKLRCVPRVCRRLDALSPLRSSPHRPPAPLRMPRSARRRSIQGQGSNI